MKSRCDLIHFHLHLATDALGNRLAYPALEPSLVRPYSSKWLEQKETVYLAVKQRFTNYHQHMDRLQGLKVSKPYRTFNCCTDWRSDKPYNMLCLWEKMTTASPQERRPAMILV